MSLKQTCYVKVTGRRLQYGRALEIIQNEEYLSAIDFDKIRRFDQQRKHPLLRIKRHPTSEFRKFREMDHTNFTYMYVQIMEGLQLPQPLRPLRPPC